MLSNAQVLQPCGVEMVIDLHGYSLEKAKFCVLHSLAHTHNLSKIRIITGRGNHINKSGERGVLYKTLRSWLTESSYQSRIEKVMVHDGYYEIHLHDTPAAQNYAQMMASQHHDLRPDINIVKPAADRGDPRTQFIAAVCLTERAVREDDFKEAFKYFLLSANNGNADAMISVARCYMVGRGVRQNDVTAVEWLQKALTAGQFEAPLLLGDCYCCGDGVAQNFKQMFVYYVQSAANNDPVGMRKLASAYQTGHGTKKDPHKAFEWYKKAADLGEVTSQYNVAAMLEKKLENGSPAVNPAQIFEYFLRAAQGGDPDAQCKVGSCYLLGEYVAENPERANYWLNLAATNGSAQAAELLRWHKPNDLTLLARSAQAGNIHASVELKLMQRHLLATPETLDQLFLESYAELRDLPLENIFHLEHKSKFFFLDQLLIDKNRGYSAKALQALDSMANQGCAFSLRRLIHAYHNGVGIAPDNARVLVYLRMATQLHDGKATMTLATAHERGGFGLAASPKQAMLHYEQAASFDYPPAHYRLGLIFCEKGETQKGIDHLQRAIDLENDESTCKERYASGFIDRYVAIKPEAAFRLGMACLSETHQIAKGFRYIQLAIDWGNEHAQEFLAETERRGFLDRMPAQWFQPAELADDGVAIIPCSVPNAQPAASNSVQHAEPPPVPLTVHNEHRASSSSSTQMPIVGNPNLELLLAVKSNIPSHAVEALLASGADLSSRDNDRHHHGWNVLHWAVHLGNEPVINALLACPSCVRDIDAQTSGPYCLGFFSCSGGHTALHILSKANYQGDPTEQKTKKIRIATLLLTAHANPNLLDSSKRPAMSSAELSEVQAMQQLGNGFSKDFEPRPASSI